MNTARYFNRAFQKYCMDMMNSPRQTVHRIKPSSSSYSYSSIRKPARFLLAASPALLLGSAAYTPEDIDASPVNQPRSPMIAKMSSPSNPLKMSIDSEEFEADISETRLSAGISVVPHPAKRAKGGEDAYFFSSDMSIIGVADGVGGWADLGVDPAIYSRSLMEGARQAAEHSRDPLVIMNEGYKFSAEVTGSSTCCICVLDGLVLRAANLGDSGFMVIRGTEIIFRTTEQQHAFNSPYQLGTGSSDLPEHSQMIEVDVQPGDLVVVGSDGLFDNLFDDEILDMTLRAHEPVTISQLIARRAYAVANDKNAISPFSHIARQCGWPLAIGGKLDDITVVVARVVLSSDISMAA